MLNLSSFLVGKWSEAAGNENRIQNTVIPALKQVDILQSKDLSCFEGHNEWPAAKTQRKPYWVACFGKFLV